MVAAVIVVNVVKFVVVITDDCELTRVVTICEVVKILSVIVVFVLSLSDLIKSTLKCKATQI